MLLTGAILSDCKALQSVMLACLCLQGREQEITIADLVHVASEEQQAWFQQKETYQVPSLGQLHARCLCSQSFTLFTCAWVALHLFCVN